MQNEIYRCLPFCDFIVIVGGDGTINHTIHSLCLSEHHDSLQKPLLLVPAGMMNSISLSCNITSVEESIAALKRNKIVELPLWEVRINDIFVKYMCSYFAIGTFATIVQNMWKMRNFVSRNIISNAPWVQFTSCALYSVLQNRAYECSVEFEMLNNEVMTHNEKKCTDEDYENSDTFIEDHKRKIHVNSSVKMLLASQLPSQSPMCSLTPKVSVGGHTLSAIVADETASRVRLWHLLKKESKEGQILEEDGVMSYNNISKMRISLLDNNKTQKYKDEGVAIAQNHAIKLHRSHWFSNSSRLYDAKENECSDERLFTQENQCGEVTTRREDDVLTIDGDFVKI